MVKVFFFLNLFIN